LLPEASDIINFCIVLRSVETDALRELAWSGVPPFLRPTVWRLLLVSLSVSFRFHSWALLSQNLSIFIGLGYTYR
jgi:hypothetical protein